MAFIETPAKKASDNWFFCPPSKNMAGGEEEKKGRGGYENKVFHSKPTLLLAYVL